MDRKKLRIGFDLLGSKVFAYRGGLAMGDRALSPANKEDITEEFERAMAMYVGSGGDGARWIQFMEDGELVTFQVQLKRVETTRRLRERPRTLLSGKLKRQAQ